MSCKPPLELKYLVEAVEEVIDWHALGLQLGIQKHVLDTIERNYMVIGGIQRCKSEMLQCWLNNRLDHSWEEIDHAVKEIQMWCRAVESRKEEEERQMEEQRKLNDAINQIVKSLEDVKIVGSKCVDEKRDLQEKLDEKNREWKNLQKVWKKQDELAMEREQRTEGVKKAIRDGNFAQSQFVMTFLREKGLPANLSTEHVDACLREHVVSEEAKRAKELLSRRIDIANHQRAINRLQNDSERWIKLREDYIEKLEDEIGKGFENFLNPKKLAGFKRELRGLERVLNDCKSASKDCDKSWQEMEDHLRECRNRLEVLNKSFSNSIQELCDSSFCVSVHRSKVQEELSILEYVLRGAWSGAAIAPDGYRTLGAMAGGAFGFFTGLTANLTFQLHEMQLAAARETQQSLDREFRHSTKIYEDCQQTEKCAKDLLATMANELI